MNEAETVEVPAAPPDPVQERRVKRYIANAARRQRQVAKGDVWRHRSRPVRASATHVCEWQYYAMIADGKGGTKPVRAPESVATLRVCKGCLRAQTLGDKPMEPTVELARPAGNAAPAAAVAG